jgi:hypothetical protein
MANGNVELWIEVAAIIVGLVGALAGGFASAYFGSKKIHALEAQQRQMEETEKVRDFEEATLRRLKWYASVLSKKEIKEERDKLENLLTSLRFGDASDLYYKISKEERKEIDTVLNLLYSCEYSNAKNKIDLLLNQ